MKDIKQYYINGQLHSEYIDINASNYTLKGYHDNGNINYLIKQNKNAWNGLCQWWYKFGTRKHLIQYKNSGQDFFDFRQHGIGINFNGNTFHYSDGYTNMDLKTNKKHAI
jgi:antitoxin component YwqK of YwqJK toxin-antitoxin module